MTSLATSAVAPNATPVTTGDVPSGAAPRGVGELADLLDPVLRAWIRSDHIDPQRDSVAVRTMATELVREHDDRSLTGAVAPVGDVAGLVDELVARVAGFGPLQRHLDDPTVEEIWINDPSLVP